MDPIERYEGAMLGLAAGDALGAAVAQKEPGSFAPVSDLAGGGPFGLEPGQWTDDTAMALCLAESLINLEKFDLCDQLERYLRWYRNGHLSSNGRCFDIGSVVREALNRFETTREPRSCLTHRLTAGNGALVRLAPVPLFYAYDPERGVALSAESARATHGALESIDACRYLGALLLGAIHGAPKEKLLSAEFEPVVGLWRRAPLSEPIRAIARESYRRKKPPEIRGSGYSAHCLEAALWAFHRSSSFKEGALLAVNLGEEADSTGAVYGQLAGAFYGVEGIPIDWRVRLARKAAIQGFARKLHRLSQHRRGLLSCDPWKPQSWREEERLHPADG